MRGASDEPERWQAFARHLERLVQARAEHARALEAALAQSGIGAKAKRALGLR
jgi:hypothetical protein